jgi:hypothetical protein
MTEDVMLALIGVLVGATLGAVATVVTKGLMQAADGLRDRIAKLEAADQQEE